MHNPHQPDQSPSSDSSSPSDELIVQDTDDSSQDESLASFQLPAPMFQPLYRTDSILKRKLILEHANNNQVKTRTSTLTAQHDGGDDEQEEFEMTDVPPLEGSSFQQHNDHITTPNADVPLLKTSTNTKRVKFASHVQVQHTLTQYQRSGIPPPYHLNFWRRNRIVHVLSLCTCASIVVVQAIILGVFWNQTCTKPIQFIFMGDVLSTGVLFVCITVYATIRFVLFQMEQHRRRILKQKTLKQLKSLKKRRQHDLGFDTPSTPVSVTLPSHANTISVRSRTSPTHSSKTTSSTINDADSTHSTVHEHQIHIHTHSFHKDRPNSRRDSDAQFSGNFIEGITRVESDEDDISDFDSRASSPVPATDGALYNGSPVLVSSLRTKVVEASIADSSSDDDACNADDDCHSIVEEMKVGEEKIVLESSQTNDHCENGSGSGKRPSSSTEDTSSSEHSNQSKNGNQSTSVTTVVDSTTDPRPPAGSASISTLPPVRPKFRASKHKRRSLKHRKFRDSIVLNKKHFRQMKQDSELETQTPNISIPVITQVQISENPKQDYRILSRSIQEVENGTLMLEPLADHETAKPHTKSIQALVQYFVRRKLFGFLFFLTWSMAHLWGIVSLVFIINYGNCPTQSPVLYFLNAIFFVCMV
eukprot:CAMPEP_0117452350 /NCGR_PEP_ID=MMETSP0759-20121206/9560_1 /TAXON_ID=63605 /ORGANISM="Percolomonas cosmopolitus, Strain WS" /LENGTH=644 /DNA_ID=CAMNT_0005245143 /DNA_START=330 /DNA_END=2260 /DNA_ORIENTATION=-